MPTGSYVNGGILTASGQQQNVSYYYSGSSGQQQSVNVNSTILYLLTYPIGYSGSVPREVTAIPTASTGGGGPVVPTVGQVWPRGNW